MEKIKIYYDKETGYLCNRYPKDIEVKKDTPFIEVSEEEANKTYVVEYGKFWAVKDGVLQKRVRLHIKEDVGISQLLVPFSKALTSYFCRNKRLINPSQDINKRSRLLRS